MTAELARLRIRNEADVFAVRQRTRDIAHAVGFDTTDQVRIAIVISELGRLVVAKDIGAAVAVELADRGSALAINFESDAPIDLGNDQGSPVGLDAIGRLMDSVVVADGARLSVRMSKRLPAGQPQLQAKAITALRERLANQIVASPLESLQAQNMELLQTLEALKAEHEELVRLNDELQQTNAGVMAMYAQLSTELEETNRGVVALYAELDERGEQLRDANNAKSKFLASVSHELRSPLNSVLALASLLREPDSEPLTASQDNQVRLIETSATQLLNLVNDLLDLAKAESGALRLDVGAVNIEELFSDLRATLRPITPDDIDLVFDVQDDLPTVATDAVLLAQLLRNLISNALKFTPSGQVTVTASQGTAHTVTFVVKDTGIGIAREYQALVFEEFFQVPGQLQARSKSTGLGLPYARRVASALDGTLTLESEPGLGSAFTATIPVGGEQPDDVETTLGLSTVLIADDDAGYRTILRDMLGRAADHIVEAEDAPGALELMTRFRPDVVLLDIRMPGGGGQEVLDRASVDMDLRQIPVVVVSSLSSEELTMPAMGPRCTILDKAGLSRPALLAAVRSATAGGGV